MENIYQLLINAMGWSIIHSLWQGASLYIILYGLFLIFYNWSADTKYKIAFLFQCLIFISFVTTIIKTLHFSSNAILSDSTSQREFYDYIEKLQKANWSITKVFPYLVILYTIGILIQTFLCIKSFDWLKKIKHCSSQVIPSEWLEKLEEIKIRHKISSKVCLLISPKIEGAITFGVLKPLIIFPTAYINNITHEEAEAILLHEIAHIKRNDYFFNIILISIETILFFNPFVWLVSRHIKTEREQSCDDFVTKHIPNPIIYAKILLHVEILRNEYQTSQALALSGDNKYDLLNRIKRINKQIMETKYTSYKQQLGVILCASITFLLIAWANPQPKENITRINNKITVTSFHEENNIISTQDTINTKHQYKVKKAKSIIKIDTAENILNDEKEFQELSKKIETDNKNLEEIFNSPEWKVNIKTIDENAKIVVEYFNSSKWKENIAHIEENARKIEAEFNSPESIAKYAQIEKNAKKNRKFL